MQYVGNQQSYSAKLVKKTPQVIPLEWVTLTPLFPSTSVSQYVGLSKPRIQKHLAKSVGLHCFQILLTHVAIPHQKYSPGEEYVRVTLLYCNSSTLRVNRTSQISPETYTLTQVLYTFLTNFIYLHSIIVNQHIQSFNLSVLCANILGVAYYSGNSSLQAIFSDNTENPEQFYRCNWQAAGKCHASSPTGCRWNSVLAINHQY